MKFTKKHISTTLGIIVMLASILPAVHAFYHGQDASAYHSSIDFEITKASADCNLCDFHLSSSTTPLLYNYEIFNTQKEIAYAISLADTVNLFPNRLFSLRAPPVC